MQMCFFWGNWKKKKKNDNITFSDLSRENSCVLLGSFWGVWGRFWRVKRTLLWLFAFPPTGNSVKTASFFLSSLEEKKNASITVLVTGEDFEIWKKKKVPKPYQIGSFFFSSTRDVLLCACMCVFVFMKSMLCVCVCACLCVCVCVCVCFCVCVCVFRECVCVCLRMNVFVRLCCVRGVSVTA